MKRFVSAGFFCIFLSIAIGVLAADPDMVIYYSFDSFAAFVPDESGKGHDATVVGDIKPDAGGKRGGAAKFTKTDTGSFLDLKGETFTPSDLPIDAIAICAWAKPEVSTDQHELFSARSGTVNFHCEFRTDGRVRWILRTDANSTIFEINNGAWIADEWNHFAGVYDSATKIGALYINGELVEAKEGTGEKALNWSAGARIGMTVDNARPFIGLLDDFCIFKKSLSQDEIKVLMESGPPTAASVSPKDSIAKTWGEIKSY